MKLHHVGVVVGSIAEQARKYQEYLGLTAVSEVVTDAIQKVNVQFLAEFFNILNRANFAVPATPTNTDIFLSTGPPTGVAGLLTSTTTTSRQIQFALKVGW